ncbi:MAG TPA: hypothetical protein VGB77_06545 [Abditibacteriaceae bacterium]
MELLSGQLHDGESNAAVIACNDWLRLGPGRSLRRLLDIYDRAKNAPSNPPKPTGTHQNSNNNSSDLTFSYPYEPPTCSLDTIKGWSVEFNWKSRAVLFDQEGEDEKNARRKEVFEQGFGLDFGRVEALQNIAKLLYSQIFETSLSGENDHVFSVQGSRAREFHNLWVQDSKLLGTGEGAERVDIERFNSALLSEFRSCLTEIAQETGGRRKGAQLEAFIKKVQERLDTSKLNSQQVERIRAGEHWITVLLEPYMLSD